MNKKILYYLSIPLLAVNVWLFSLVIIYGLVSASYGHYSFSDIILQPNHILTFTFSILGIVFFVIETTARIHNKKISTTFIVSTFITLTIAPIIVFGGIGL